VALAASLVPLLIADGGAVILHHEGKGLVVTVFESPAPAHAGLVDLSVLVQKADSLDPVLDATVTLVLKQGELEQSAQATREQAQNKLLYAAAVDLSRPGNWDYVIHIQSGTEKEELAGTLTIGSEPAKLSAYWIYFIWPPILILLFVVHQWLVYRKQVHGKLIRSGSRSSKGGLSPSSQEQIRFSVASDAERNAIA